LELKSLLYADCNAKQLKWVSMTLYNRAGDFLENSENQFAPYNNIVPETIGESILTKVCSNF
jgi:hypothetical protein